MDRCGRSSKPLTCPFALGVQGLQERSTVFNAGRIQTVCSSRGPCWFCSLLFSQCLAHSRIIISVSCCLRPSSVAGNETTGFDNSEKESISFLWGEMLRGLRIWKMVPTVNFYFFNLCALQVGRGQEVACYLSYIGHHCWGVGINSISEPKGFPPCSVKHRIGSRILTEEEIHGLEQGFLNLSIHQNHLESLLKHKWQDPAFGGFWLSQCGEGLRMCISDNFLGDTYTAHPPTTCTPSSPHPETKLWEPMP